MCLIGEPIELGYLPLAEVAAELLFQVIAERAEKAAINERTLFFCPNFRLRHRFRYSEALSVIELLIYKVSIFTIYIHEESHLCGPTGRTMTVQGREGL